MTRTINRRIQALETQTNFGRVTVYLPERVEDEAKAVEDVLKAPGYEPATSQVVSVLRDEMIDEPFAAPFVTHVERVRLLSGL